MPTCVSIYLSVCLPLHLCSYLSIYLSICLSVCLAVCLSVCPSLFEAVYLSNCLSIYFICPIDLPSCLSAYLQDWKQSYCARVRWIVAVESGKTKLFCETSFKFGNRQHHNFAAILPDFNQTLKVECWAYSLIPMRFAIFPCHLSKLLRMPRKSEARSCEIMRCHAKLANLKIGCCKINPSEEISALTS